MIYPLFFVFMNIFAYFCLKLYYMKKSLISKKAQSELEKRIHNELSAEYMYRSLSNTMNFIGWFGAAKFFLNEAKNEAEHYQKIIEFLNQVGILPNLMIVSPISDDVKNIKDAFNVAYKAEYDLKNLYDQNAIDFKDEPAVFQFLQFYVEEQRSSVGEMSDYISRLELCGDNEAALLEFDNELED